MMARKLLAVLLSTAITAPCGAGQARRSVTPPSITGGTILGVDPYVAEYEQTMTSLEKQLADTTQAIKAIKVPPKAGPGALAIRVLIMAEYVKFAVLKAEAAKAHAKLTAHLRRKNTKGLKYGSIAKAEAASDGAQRQAKTGTTLRPHDDGIFKGPRPGRGRSASAAAAGGVDASAAAPKPVMALLPPNRYSYASPAPANFEPMTAPTQGIGQQGAGASNAPPSAIGAGGGGQAMNGAGYGTGGGGGQGLGATSSSEGKPPVNPSNESLSKNTSDVAAKEAARQEKIKEENKAAAEKRREEEQQRKQQQQQMAMQAAQQAAQAASQAAQKGQEGQGQGQGGGGGGGQDFNAAVQAAADQRNQDFINGFNQGVAAGKGKGKEAGESGEDGEPPTTVPPIPDPAA